MPTHLRLAHYGLGLNRYQTGARIVRQAGEQAEPEYIRPDTTSSKPGSDARRLEVHNNVRWGIGDMGMKAWLCKSPHPGRGGTARCLPALAKQVFSDARSLKSASRDSATPMPADPDASPLEQILTLSREIVDDCPSCAGKASQIAMWAHEIRERRPSRQELEALVDATCRGLVPDDQRKLLIEGLRALVRFAE